MTATRRKTRRTSEEMWSSIFEDWRKSGLSPEDFCAKEKYSLYGFNHFYEKQFGEAPVLESSTHAVADEPMFVPLNVVHAQPAKQDRVESENSKIKICVGNRPIVIRVQAGFDPIALKQVFDVLGGL